MAEWVYTRARLKQTSSIVQMKQHTAASSDTLLYYFRLVLPTVASL